MTTAAAAPQPGQAGKACTIHLSEVLKRPITDKAGEPLGRLSDVVVRLRSPGLPLVVGGVARVGGWEVLVPAAQVSSFDGEVLKLTKRGVGSGWGRHQPTAAPPAGAVRRP
ncbi:hypothetical protein [Trebonia sp.]|uniref:hypothetical protein n=1 Tax=Trebonia sp. TaxID=2767075 RepID=UPI00260DAE42|nr:hypothetical protein [Trebonia sp.]